MLLLLQHPILAQVVEPAMVQGLALEPAGTPVVVSALPTLKVSAYPTLKVLALLGQMVVVTVLIVMPGLLPQT